MRHLLLLLLATLVPAGASAAPIAVTDDLDRAVRLDAPAQRVVSLAPHATELLFAAGAGTTIVGAVSHSDYPPAARDIPRVGGYDAVDVERILALEPDLVVAWDSGNGHDTVERLQRLGLSVFVSEPRHLGQIADSLARLGRLTGNAAIGEAAARRFRARRDRLRRRFREQPTVPVFYEVWHQPLMTVNGDHLISQVIRLCGGRNVFADLSPLVPTVGTEAVLAADPEAIVAGGMGGERPEWLARWRDWSGLTAAARGNLFHIPPDLTQRATPRLLDGAERLCRQLQTARERRPETP